MVGKTFTYLVGSEAAALMFNSKNDDLNAEDVYSRLTTPVFGKGVAYDVPNHVRLCALPEGNTLITMSWEWWRGEGGEEEKETSHERKNKHDKEVEWEKDVGANDGKYSIHVINAF